jgi:hypothetical protein
MLDFGGLRRSQNGVQYHAFTLVEIRAKSDTTGRTRSRKLTTIQALMTRLTHEWRK